MFLLKILQYGSTALQIESKILTMATALQCLLRLSVPFHLPNFAPEDFVVSLSLPRIILPLVLFMMYLRDPPSPAHASPS